MNKAVFLFAFVGLATPFIGEGDFVKSPELRPRIAVIDTGLDLEDTRFSGVLCADGHKDFTGTTIKDVHGHGTHIAGLIMRNATVSNYCLMILKFYSDKQRGPENLAAEVRAIRHATRYGAKVYNISGGGPVFSEEEYLAIKDAAPAKFIVAAGNAELDAPGGKDIDRPKNHYYPAYYQLPNIVSVGNLIREGVKNPSSNYGNSVKVWEIGTDVVSFAIGSGETKKTGTSQATAVTTGKMLKELLR